MADKAISELTPAATVMPTDRFVLEQNDEAKSLSGQVLVKYLLRMLDGHGGIQSLGKIDTKGVVDTYRITFADGHSVDYAVTNGVDGASTTITGERVDELDSMGVGGVRLTITTRTPQEDGTEKVSGQRVSVYDGRSISGVSVETLEPGSNATAQIVFPMANKMDLHLGIPQGERGDSGVTTPVNSFFTLSVDEDGNLWAHSSESESVPEFEYDEETGALYFVTEQEE